RRAATPRASDGPGGPSPPPPLAAVLWSPAPVIPRKRRGRTRWPRRPDGHRSGGPRAPLLARQHREGGAGRVLVPGDFRARPPGDPLLVLLHLLVALELDASGGQAVDRRVDVVDREVEDRVGGRLEVWFRVDQDVAATGKMQAEQARPAVHLLDLE